jgi:hypothetical protein
MISGTPRFGALSVHEVAITFTSISTVITSKAAFVDPTRNVTHGWTKGEGGIWSPETIALAQQLRAALETDLARVHFSEFAVQGVGAPLPEPSGLGEFVNGDAPQL